MGERVSNICVLKEENGKCVLSFFHGICTFDVRDPTAVSNNNACSVYW